MFVGGVVAACTTPATGTRTVGQQAMGPATPAAQDRSGAAAGPVTGAAPAGGAPAGAATNTTGGSKATPGSSATTKTRGTAGTRPATTAPPVTTAPAAAPRLQPDAGTYPLRIAGTSAVDGKPSTVPSTGSLVVEARGTDQQHRTVGVPGNLVLLQRAGAGGVDLVSFSLNAASKTVSFQPAAPLAFIRTQPGASWNWSVRSTDGSVTLNQTASVTGGGTVTVAGTQVPAVTVQRVFTVSGAVQGTVQLASTLSLVDRLPLIQHEVIDIRATTLGFISTRIVSDTTATLTATRPQ